jgi:hypothetical protein
MIINKIIAFCFFTLVLGSIPCSAAQRDYSYFGGVNLTWHDRLATFGLGNDHEQKENRPLLFSAGLRMGKRLILPFHVRLSLPLLFDYGSVNEDTLKNMALSDGTTPDVVLESSFYHIGLSPEIQFVLPTANELKLFLSIGGGIHYVFLQQDEMAGKTRIIDPQYIEDFGGIRWSVCAGLGADLIILQHFGLEFQYLFRYWHPVKGTTDKELFPLGKVEYKERFFSHGFAVSVLINRGD